MSLPLTKWILDPRTFKKKGIFYNILNVIYFKVKGNPSEDYPKIAIKNVIVTMLKIVEMNVALDTSSGFVSN